MVTHFYTKYGPKWRYYSFLKLNNSCYICIIYMRHQINIKIYNRMWQQRVNGQIWIFWKFLFHHTTIKSKYWRTNEWVVKTLLGYFITFSNRLKRVSVFQRFLAFLKSCSHVWRQENMSIQKFDFWGLTIRILIHQVVHQVNHLLIIIFH